MIYICDMIKQFLLKVLKEEDVNDNISLSLLELLGIILKKGKEGKQKDLL